MESRRWLDYALDGQFPCTSAANVTLYPESHELNIDGQHVHCNRSQFRLLSSLLSSFCRTVPYNRLLPTRDREPNSKEQNLLAVQICYLRRLLRSHRAEVEIRNIYGKGYQARPKRA